MRARLYLVLSLSVSLAAIGCGDDAGDNAGGNGGGSAGAGGSAGTGGNSDCEFDTTFQAIQSIVFDARGCTNAACHGRENGSGGLDLRPENAYDNIVRAAASQVDPNVAGITDRIDPGDEENSLLWLKLAAKVRGDEINLMDDFGIGGFPMPLTGDAISADELELLRIWIRAGAREDTIDEGTQDLLNCEGGPPDVTPNKIDPLPVPEVAKGVQIYSGAWDLPAESEDEVCYATYYNYADEIPAEQQFDCADVGLTGPEWGAGRKCFAFGRNELAQDAQSHHSIIDVYTPPSDPLGSDWGGADAWKCAGGDSHDQPCDPTVDGVCGARSQCATRRQTRPACVGYTSAAGAPPLLGGNLGGGGSQTAVSLGGSQESTAVDLPYEGVFSVLPVDGFVSWNSHAFNLTKFDTTIEQWVNLDFVAPADRQFIRQGIFRANNIFQMSDVVPYEAKEICMTYSIPRYSRLMSTSSHMHKRGKRFRIWLPPNDWCGNAGSDCPGGGSCSSNINDPAGPDGKCAPADRTPDYTSFIYDDPIYLDHDPFDPALVALFDSADLRDRTFRACAVYDNGGEDPSLVKRDSNKPDAGTCGFPGIANCGCPESQRACVGGANEGVACGNEAADFCGEGACDACPLKGGITTDDEMFIPLGSFFVQPPS